MTNVILHCNNIMKLGDIVLEELQVRLFNHDYSKFDNKIERDFFRENSKELSKVGPGDKDYDKVLADKAIMEHYKNNDHHPEHFEKGICGMNIIQLNEMIIDWIVSSKGKSSTWEEGFSFVENSLKDRFKLEPQLFHIIKNSYEYLWDKVEVDKYE